MPHCHGHKWLPNPEPDAIPILPPTRIISRMKPERLSLYFLNGTIVRQSSVERPLKRPKLHAGSVVRETSDLARCMNTLVCAARQVDRQFHPDRFEDSPLEFSLHRSFAGLSLRTEELFSIVRESDLKRPGWPPAALQTEPGGRLTRRTQSTPSRRHRHAELPTWRCACILLGWSRTAGRSLRTAWPSPVDDRSST